MSIVKRSQLSRPLTCAEYDGNLDATLDRSNHLGTQSALTIYNLEEVVGEFDFISALQACCTSLTGQLAQLQQDLFGQGQLSSILDSLRTELLTITDGLTANVVSLQTSLASLTGRVTTLENNYGPLVTSVQTLSSSVSTLTSQLSLKANVISPTFTGVVTVPQPDPASSDQTAATTAFVKAQNLMPIGTVIPFAGATAPTGYLLARGQAVSRVTYAPLFTICSITYGAGDGATTFNLPNMQGRVAIGAGTSPASGLAYNTGDVGGAESRILSTANLAAHSHTVIDSLHTHTIFNPPHSHTAADTGHTHGVRLPGGNTTGIGNAVNDTDTLNGNTVVVSSDTGFAGIVVNSATTGVYAGNSGSGISLQNTGTNTPVNIMQPYLTLNYIIKT